MPPRSGCTSAMITPGAIKLYQDLGFQEMARRTTWQASPEHRLALPDTEIQIVPRHPRFWPLQQEWLRRLYPKDTELVPILEHKRPSTRSLELVLPFVHRFQRQTMGGGAQ